MHDPALHDVQVLIAGGGPVGITLAMELASRGVRAVVLESRDDLPPNPRCNTTNARSMEIFRRLGCADAVRRAGLPAAHCTDVVYMTRMNGDELLRFERPTPAQVFNGTPQGIGADWPTPEPQHFISQLFLEPVLRAHATQALQVDLRTGWELVSFTQDEDGVTAEVREMASGQHQRLRAAYLVGADGGASGVRRAIGARLEGIPEIRTSCSVFMRAPRLSALHQQHPGWMYRFPGSVNIVAIDGHDQWLIHTHVPPGIDKDTFDPDPAIFRAVGETFEYETISVSRWTSRAMVCNKWRDGRVFLAGDAAHLWIPMGGFGMNAGIGDAVALAWRLWGVTEGWLDPAALDSYECERASLGERVAGQANRWGAELRPLLALDDAAVDRLDADPSARQALAGRIEAVNRTEWDSCGLQLGAVYQASPVIAYDATPAPPFQLDGYVESSSPGARPPHVWREGRPGVALFDDFGPGFTLLRLGQDPPTATALTEAASARGLPLKVLDVPEPEAWQKYQGHGLVLVRPDQVICWRSMTEPSAEDARRLLDHLSGRSMALTPTA